MIPREIENMFMLLPYITILYSHFFAWCVLSVFYIIVGVALCMINTVFELINSIEHPLLVKFRQFLKRCLRMMFWKKTYRRVGYYELSIRKGDSYIDELLQDMIEKNGEEYEPYVLEDSSVGFHKKVMFVNVSGEAKLHDGYIKGLSTLHRTKHCSLHNERDKLRVKADLGAGELEFHYKGAVKFMNFGPTITIDGTLSYIEVHMEFKVNSNTGKEGKLTKFIIDDMRGMKVRVTGLGPINWAVNPIISGVTKIFKRFTQNFMENKVQKHIREHIPNYQFPVEGGENTVATETSPSNWPEETTAPTVWPGTLEPETAAPKETPQPEPETAAPEETPQPEPETAAPEETPQPDPETAAPEETPQPDPETAAPEETPQPDPETEDLDVISESEPEENSDVEEIYLPETPDSSILDDINSEDLEDVSEKEELDSESSKESYIPDSDLDSENYFI